MKRHDLKKKVKVTFAGEPGLDWGGLTKEWFLLLVRKIFQPDFGEWWEHSLVLSLFGAAFSACALGSCGQLWLHRRM